MILAFVCNYKTYYMKAVSPANNQFMILSV